MPLANKNTVQTTTQFDLKTNNDQYNSVEFHVSTSTTIFFLAR